MLIRVKVTITERNCVQRLRPIHRVNFAIDSRNRITVEFIGQTRIKDELKSMIFLRNENFRWKKNEEIYSSLNEETIY